MSKGETLKLPPQVDARGAATVWKGLAGSIPAVIDFAEVAEIDSAGLALVAELCSRRSGIVLQNVPERFAKLCEAHRVDKELLK